MKKVPMILAILFFVLNFFDGFLTMLLIDQYGILIEANPLVKWTIEAIGDWFLLPKVIIGALLSFLIIIWWDGRKRNKISISATISFYIVIVINHFLILMEVI